MKAWKSAKAICMAYIMAFVAGWMTRSWFRGKISPENKAVMFVVLAAVLTIVIIFCTVGLSRWRKGTLSAMEKRIMVFSLAVFPVLFVFGWRSDLP